MLLPAQFYIISSVLVLFGTKNPSASTAEVPRYQQVSVISLTRHASAGSFPGWGNSPHSREGHGVTVQLCIPSTDCSGQPKDELQQFTITIHTERHFLSCPSAGCPSSLHAPSEAILPSPHSSRQTRLLNPRVAVFSTPWGLGTP